MKSSLLPEIQLDREQQQAVEHVHGPMLVLAGAGTGKTSVLVERIARLIEGGNARAGEVLAVAYNIEAAKEIAERVKARIGPQAEGLEPLTYHACGYQLLSRHGRGFTTLIEQDLWIYLRQNIHQLPLKHFIRAADVGKFLTELIDFFSRCHDELTTPADYDRYLDEVRAGRLPLPRVAKASEAGSMGREEVLERCREISQVFHASERMLREHGLGTFSHQIARAVELLRSDAKVLEIERRRARFVLLDEFQDSNLAQIELARLLAGDARNVFAVGDPDQAIYRFRGASSAVIEEFLQHFPGTRVLRLGRNHRSTPSILGAAYAVIRKNPEVSGDGAPPRAVLVSARDEHARETGSALPSPPVGVVSAPSKDDEAFEVAAVIAELQAQGAGLSDIAVLYRIHEHHAGIAQELARRGIAFAVVGLDILHTPEARDLIAGLCALLDPAEGVSLLRVAALPRFGVEPEALRRALVAAGKAGMPQALGKVAGGKKVLRALADARTEAEKHGMDALACFDLVVRDFGFPPMENVTGKVRDFIVEWQKKPEAVRSGAQLSEFLAYLEYFPQARGKVSITTGGEGDAVRLMTAHVAKGREFGHVLILRAHSPSFPWRYVEPLFEFPGGLRASGAAAGLDSRALHDEEERRLFYVAMTRARDSLTILSKPSRGKTPKLSGYPADILSGAGSHARASGTRDVTVDLHAAADALVRPPGEWLTHPLTPSAHPVLSASAIEDYNTCPLRYKIAREWNLRAGAGAPMQFGAAMHTALKAYGDTLCSGRPLEAENVVACFRSEFEKAVFPDKVQRALYQKLGERQLRAFLEARKEAPAGEVVSSERSFEHLIGKVRVRGRVDRLDRMDGDRVAIIDYKTGAPRSQDDADESLQLSLYAIAAREAWSLVPEQLVFYNLETNAAVSTTRSEKQLQEARQTVEDVAQSIAQGMFDAKPGFHCKRCPYSSICPETEQHLLGLSDFIPAAPKENA